MLTDWWNSDDWHAYERAYGDPPGTRSRLLADASWRTRVLDLWQDEATLWRGVRRSYHALVNGLAADPTLAVVGVMPDVFLRWCPALHAAAAGRATRSDETWRIQADWLDRDLARAYVALRDRDPQNQVAANVEPVAFAYVLTVGPWAYYFSAASVEPNVLHLVQWRTILALKTAGLAAYELGWQQQAADEKGRNIEFFRRGFGGDDVAVAEAYRA